MATLKEELNRMAVLRVFYKGLAEALEFKGDGDLYSVVADYDIKNDRVFYMKDLVDLMKGKDIIVDEKDIGEYIIKEYD